MPKSTSDTIREKRTRRLIFDGAIHAELLRLAIPTVISTLAVPLLGIVDTMVLGLLPDVAQLAAAATTNVIFSSVFFVAGVLRMGTTGLVAQAWGRDDRHGAALVLFQALFLSVVLGVTLIALQNVISGIGFAIIGATQRVTELGASYFAIRIWEAPIALMMLGIMGYFRGQGDAMVPMYLTLGINLVNIIGDVLLVPGLWGLPSLGIAGAAWASVIAQGTGWLIAAAIVWRRVRPHWEWTWLQRWRRLSWRRFLFVQSDLFFRTLALVLTMGAATSLAARLHVVHELAAHAILLQLWSLVAFGVDGFAYATETTVGTWLGRRKEEKAWASSYAALLWGTGAGVLFALAYVVGVDWISRLFTHDQAVQDVLRDMVWIVAASQPVNALAFLFDGILIGATDTRYLRNAMVLSAVGFALFIAVGWLTAGLSLTLIWWGLVFWMLARTVTLWVRFRSGMWTTAAQVSDADR